MSVKRNGWVLSALIFASAVLAGGTSSAEVHGARMTIVGTIVAVNAKAGIAVVRHQPLETAPSGTVQCRMHVPAQLRHLRVGMTIQAIADTAKQPWTLWDVHVLGKAKASAAG